MVETRCIWIPLYMREIYLQLCRCHVGSEVREVEVDVDQSKCCKRDIMHRHDFLQCL